MAGEAQPSGRAQLRQIAAITLAAVALFLLVRRLPTGMNLDHGDFRVAGGNSLEFCDPANPQFLPVVDVRSPVTTTLVPATAAAGRAQAFTLTLRTITGKPVGPEDLAEAHTRKLHLLVVDPSLEDYQHVHPETGDRPGEWRFALTPRRAGTYRVFADFVPLATGRGLYAVAEFAVPGTPGSAMEGDRTTYQINEYSFRLETPATIRAREPAELVLALARSGGGLVPLRPVMGAFAHLVAFDRGRTGFAHLHPRETDLTRPPDAERPRLTFKVTLPRPGGYVVWAQVNLAGREVYAPFAVTAE